MVNSGLIHQGRRRVCCAEVSILADGHDVVSSSLEHVSRQARLS